jgi:hypothetical protein
MGGQETQEERQHERRVEHRRAFAQDITIGVMLGIVIVIAAWGMCRLDDRSERLFNIVATERAGVPAGTRGP